MADNTNKGESGTIRVPTGVPNFDVLIEGGFKKNSINLVVGGAGSGKSIFATQFLIEGMKKGEKCLFITFEERKKEFYKNMLSVGLDLSEYEKKGLLFFLEYTPLKVKTMLEEGGGAIENIVVPNKVNRIVIDSMSSFEVLFDEELSQREALLSLFDLLQKWDCTSLLTLEEEPLKKLGTLPGALEFETDSIILMYYLEYKNERRKYIEVIKMRGTEHSRRIYDFEISKGGVKVSKTPCDSVPQEII